MWETTDSGETWTQVSSSGYTNISFVSETTGYVSLGNGILLKTTDSGNTWVEIIGDMSELGSYGPPGYINDISFVSETTGYISDFLFMWETTDSGETWTQVSYPEEGGIIRDISFVSETNISTIELPTPTSKRELIKTTNILGQENITIKNQLLIETYDDGSTEKKIVLEK